MPANWSWRRAVLANSWVVVVAVAVSAGVSLPVSFDANRIALTATGQEQMVGPYRVVVIGDSYTSGSPEGGIGPTGWPSLVWENLQSQGIEVIPVLAAEGGTGYVRRGLGGTVFPEQATRTIAADDNVIVFIGGRNDTDEPLSAVTAAARQSFADARAVAPLIVIGPIFPDPGPPAALLALRDALREQAVEAGGVFLDPIAEGWLTGAGMIGADGVHPTNAGHQELAARIGPIIQAALDR